MYFLSLLELMFAFSDINGHLWDVVGLLNWRVYRLLIRWYGLAHYLCVISWSFSSCTVWLSQLLRLEWSFCPQILLLSWRKQFNWLLGKCCYGKVFEEPKVSFGWLYGEHSRFEVTCLNSLTLMTHSYRLLCQLLVHTHTPCTDLPSCTP